MPGGGLAAAAAAVAMRPPAVRITRTASASRMSRPLPDAAIDSCTDLCAPGCGDEVVSPFGCLGRPSSAGSAFGCRRVASVPAWSPARPGAGRRAELRRRTSGLSREVDLRGDAVVLASSPFAPRLGSARIACEALPSPLTRDVAAPCAEAGAAAVAEQVLPLASSPFPPRRPCARVALAGVAPLPSEGEAEREKPRRRRSKQSAAAKPSLGSEVRRGACAGAIGSVRLRCGPRRAGRAPGGAIAAEEKRAAIARATAATMTAKEVADALQAELLEDEGEARTESASKMMSRLLEHRKKTPLIIAEEDDGSRFPSGWAWPGQRAPPLVIWSPGRSRTRTRSGSGSHSRSASPSTPTVARSMSPTAGQRPESASSSPSRRRARKRRHRRGVLALFASGGGETSSPDPSPMRRGAPLAPTVTFASAEAPASAPTPSFASSGVAADGGSLAQAARQQDHATTAGPGGASGSAVVDKGAKVQLPQGASRGKAKSDAVARVKSDGAQRAMERLRGGTEDGFSDSEVARMRAAFQRFTDSGTTEMHKDHLPALLQHLGYVMTSRDVVSHIFSEVSPYSTLEFNEFCTFAQAFARYERGQFWELFQRYDVDNSGELDESELREWMVSVGFTPLRAMVKEALELVDEDKSGTLNFEELVHLVSIYRHSEGFTMPELEKLKHVFQSRGQSDETGSDAAQVEATQLKDMLKAYYGPQAAELAERLSAEVARPKADSLDETVEPPGLSLPEFLIWARRLREAEFEGYREKFVAYDEDRSGSIDRAELATLLTDLGYHLTKATISELLDECEEEYAGVAKNGTLDFDEFVGFMLNLKRRDGFSEREASELQGTFERFDADGSGEIDAVELSDMLRYMGYSTAFELVQKYVSKVDIDKNGALDFREFLRFMRLHREQEMHQLKEAFDEQCDALASRMKPSALPASLTSLGYKDDIIQQVVDELGAVAHAGGADAGAFSLQQSVQRRIFGGERQSGLDFETFVDVAEKCRQIRVRRQRRQAGFSEEEVERFRELFEYFDSDSSGTIELMELERFLESAGFEMNTLEERDRVMQALGKAQEAAAEFEDEAVIEPGQLSFGAMVQLLRLLHSRDDKRVLDREARAMEQCHFTVTEADEFRDIFNTAFMREKMYEDEAMRNAGMRRRSFSVLHPEARELSQDGVRRLLRSLGISLDVAQRARLEVQVYELNPTGVIDSADFLRLMRWMLDANFADIQGVTAKIANPLKADTS